MAASIELDEGEPPLVEFNSLSDNGTWGPGIDRNSLSTANSIAAYFFNDEILMCNMIF
jgi:hypothetical protein